MKPSLVVISTLKRRPLIDSLFVSLRRHFALDIHKIDVKTIDDFAKITRQFDLDRHDHVLLDLPHRYLRRQCRHLQPLIDKLTIYEEDACQNYMPDSRWFGDFEHFYRQLPRLRSIHTGYYVSQRMQAAGICSTFIPKGYDANVIKNYGHDRDIGLAFIGTVFSNTYHERLRMISHVKNETDLALLRTNPGAEYCDTLNRIETFFSADCGIGEYMAKNFEAMAAGCLLLAYRQGNGEEQALGLEHNKNILLYSNKQEALELIAWIRSHRDEARTIAHNGWLHAVENFSLADLSERLRQAILQMP